MGGKFTRFKRSKSLRFEGSKENQRAKDRRRKLLQPELPKLIGGSKNEVLSNPRHATTLVPQLQASLPPPRRCYDWNLLYSLAQHGCSLHTLLLKVRKSTPTLVVVKTAKGDTFGGFVSGEWQTSANYYGVGESFVFSCNTNFKCYPWSFLNTMVMFSNDEGIAMGGGGDFAWYLNSDLSRGTSGCSETFKNECLASEAEFDIYNVEVWGFVMKM
ncbi:TLD domain-containing protein 2 [Phytophthora citrophthora]|uniref:Oxidation resistance protein 1 n=1 Tax=Phytophthora citrophthora TaxID=4793 RepID=A0AAD9GIW7_9STRA|nr:TLD domain-containing protein 2 [Phytophthora citrophthora]